MREHELDAGIAPDEILEDATTRPLTASLFCTVAMAAPNDEPLSKSATAHPDSRLGNHSDTAFVAVLMRNSLPVLDCTTTSTRPSS